jgi:hypothetical protein
MTEKSRFVTENSVQGFTVIKKMLPEPSHEQPKTQGTIKSITKKASTNRFILTDEDAPGIEVLYTPPAVDHERPDTQGTITEHAEEN